MTHLRSIVVATDLSAPARRAVDRATRLARAASAPLTLVHAVSAFALTDLRRWLEQGEDAERTILEDVRTRMRDLAREISARDRIDVDQRVVVGRPVNEIAQVAEEHQADLIVMGTLGLRFFSHHLIGSTAERVVKKSCRPVLLVKHAPREPYQRVLVPVDFSAWSAPSLAIATAVAPGAHFVLLHCVQVPFEGGLPLAGIDPGVIEKHRGLARAEAMERLADLAARAGLEPGRWTAVTTTSLQPWMQIVQHEQAQDSDLIVIGKHGRNSIEELLLGSTTNVVIAETTSDVLVSTHAEAA